MLENRGLASLYLSQHLCPLQLFPLPLSRLPSSVYLCRDVERRLVYLFILVFQDEASLGRLGCPGTSAVDQVGLNLTEVCLECTTIPQLNATALLRLPSGVSGHAMKEVSGLALGLFHCSF